MHNYANILGVGNNCTDIPLKHYVDTRPRLRCLWIYSQLYSFCMKLSCRYSLQLYMVGGVVLQHPSSKLNCKMLKFWACLTFTFKVTIEL